MRAACNQGGENINHVAPFFPGQSECSLVTHRRSQAFFWGGGGEGVVQMDLLNAISTTNYRMNTVVQEDGGLWAEHRAPEISGLCECLSVKDWTILIMLFLYLPLSLTTLSHAYQQGHVTPLEALSLHKQVF